jgi:hypothetical protein
MVDNDGPDIPNAFYKHIFHKTIGTFDLRGAAEALNVATRELRKEGAPLE